MNKIIILNGPNLNLLGEREKNQYGNFTLKDIEMSCKKFANVNNIDLSMFQSNIEGELVEKIQNSRNEQHGLIINAGGYTHTSVAIHDSLKILKIPIIELHISNIYNREDFRHKSLISKIAKGIICGFGADGYIMGLNAMSKYLKK
jgi:3-dehydroquinate dehydratase II